MSRNALHTEENFWPSVSDMFLTLFVIALALYSQLNDEMGSGDEYIGHWATQEAMDLVEELQIACPNDSTIRAFLVDSLKEEDTKENQRTTLAGYVMDIVENSDLRIHFHSNRYTSAELQDARRDYKKAIELAYQCCKGLASDAQAAHAAKQLRDVRKKLLGLVKGKTGSKAPDTEENRKLREQLEREKREKQRLQEQLANVIQKLDRRSAKDTRRRVMEECVAPVIKDKSLEGLVEVEEDLGVIRIPSSSVSFLPDHKEYSTGEGVLERLAAALVAIAEKNKCEKSIDNIVIECHADTDGDPDYNEELSSMRALCIWRTLNKKSGDRLERYKNGTGLGLFSHAGFGCRVPMPLRLWEDKDSKEYKERCRRIDIRFNCTPLLGEETE